MKDQLVSYDAYFLYTYRANTSFFLLYAQCFDRKKNTFQDNHISLECVYRGISTVTHPDPFKFRVLTRGQKEESLDID